jgi:hypothetical protein
MDVRISRYHGSYEYRGSYGEKVPGARYDATGWRDNLGNLWLLGGIRL